MSHSGSDDRSDRPERPKRSWSEIDRQREKGRSDSDPHPRGRHAEARAKRATEQYVKELDSLFTSAEGGGQGEELARAMRDAHGSDGLAPACRAFREAVGVPQEPELVTLFLDSGDESLVVEALESVLERVRAGGFELSRGLRSQIAVLAEDFNDALASVAEEILARL